MPISEKKLQQLQEEMERLGLCEKDLIERFILGSSSGGQKLQKTHSTVYLKHVPSGLEVKCQKERSREMNRFFARRQLLEHYTSKVLQLKTKKEGAIEKLRKQKKCRARKRERQKESPSPPPDS
ncbi:MAG: prfA3 [Chlamydiales bacterium]|jgi:protein subunit release factor B|nr:prfA3 [Chlamydiales bacterium]